MDLKELESGVDPNTHWYYQTKKLLLLKYFEKISKENPEVRRVVDIGSGSGFFAYELYEKFPQKIDSIRLVDISYTEEELGPTQIPAIIKQHKLEEETSDSVIIMMDVLEHIENDLAILKDIQSKCQGKNYFFITVPAFEFLWSPHDEYLGHYRRYTLNSLEDLLKKAGYTINRTYYYYGMLFPVVVAARKFFRLNKSKDHSDMKPVPGVINAALKFYNKMELPFRKANKLFGVTCVAEGYI